jgi:hypothetical protein
MVRALPSAEISNWILLAVAHRATGIMAWITNARRSVGVIAS